MDTLFSCRLWLVAAILLLISGLALHARGASVPELMPATSNQSNRVKNGVLAFSDFGPEGRPQIYTMNPDGSGRRQLTRDGNNVLPAWSPDGRTIAYTKITGIFRNSSSIWIMDKDGQNKKQLTHDGHSFLPAWSPDGKRIAFVSAVVSQGNGHPQIFIMNADGSGRKQLTTDGNNAAMTWSPDGKRIAYWSGNDENGFGQIWVMDSDGSNRRQLTFPSYNSYTPHGSSANAPAWSPDGKRIAYWSGIERQYGEIWIMNADGEDKKQLTHEQAPISSDNPGWSPDGKKIFFDTSRTGKPEIWMMDPDGGNQIVLVRDVKVIPARASWQPIF